MTENEEHLDEHLTNKLVAYTDTTLHNCNLVQDMLSILATELMALKAQLSDLRTLSGNQGLAIHLLDKKLQNHVLRAEHTPLDVE